ncbi:hypothetical protein T12_1307 [Trichinella patagoniensis]|uniref:Uncharacterized protein n=1 Tax=Trichinella patagoniensis TaxID=990121 RepID=A0A0V0ZFP8_9BILA|nr:hypothetical protein T12_1307 [Trichinella patagoniensis]
MLLLLLLPPGYRCYFNDGVAGYPTWLCLIPVPLTKPLYCASPPIEDTNGLTSNIPVLAVFAGTDPLVHINSVVIHRMKMIIIDKDQKLLINTAAHTPEQRNATTALNTTSNDDCARSTATATFILACGCIAPHFLRNSA